MAQTRMLVIVKKELIMWVIMLGGSKPGEKKNKLRLLHKITYLSAYKFNTDIICHQNPFTTCKSYSATNRAAIQMR